MKKYESIFILDKGKNEDGTKGFLDQLESITKEIGGGIVETNEMGHRTLAHPINKISSAVYLNVILNAPADGVVKIKDKFRRDPKVLRADIFNYTRPVDRNSTE